MKRFLLPLILVFLPSPSFSQQNVYNECYRNVEEYIPGYYTSEGNYVGGYVKTERKSVSCGNVTYASSNTGGGLPRCNPNNTRFKGILGGAIAAAVSKPDAYLWSVPLGVALGVSASKVDCR